MANFWKDVKKTLTTTADMAAVKVGELTENAKIRLAKNSEEAKLKECYEKIGQAYYVYQRLGHDNTAEIAALIVECDALRENIRLLDQALADAGKK